MASDDFGSFLTYLPTQIRYHHMEADLPTHPNIWRQIFTISNPRIGLNRQTLERNSKLFVCVPYPTFNPEICLVWKYVIQIEQKFIPFASFIKIIGEVDWFEAWAFW